jgi:hypothetical protein
MRPGFAKLGKRQELSGLQPHRSTAPEHRGGGAIAGLRLQAQNRSAPTQPERIAAVAKI